MRGTGALTTHGFVLIVAVLASTATYALAQVDGPANDLSVRMPVRLTAGGADHRMAERSPTADALYFLGDELGTNEILEQAPIRAEPETLFDALGDFAFPRVSPDGRHLAYISFVHDSAGDACVRNLRSDSEVCLTGPDTAELEVLWIDATHVGVLSRVAPDAAYRFSRYGIRGIASGEPLFDRDMVGLALAPDGRFLAYVDVERRREEVGVRVSSRVGRGLRLQSLSDAHPDGPPLRYVPEMPGVTGSPAFSRDGRYLYFAQYLNDTNRDGAIDGSDDSVVVRVRFDASRANPLEDQRVEQLTTSRWNCHDPSPTDTSLLMTCSDGGPLDVYTLPLDGAVPATWNADRLRAELHAARDLWGELILAHRLAGTVLDDVERLVALEDVVWVHLALREYEAALYYAERIEQASGADSTRGRRAHLFGELAKHRRVDLALTSGRVRRAYLQSERDRLERVKALGHRAADANVRALSCLVASEIRDDLGDKRGAFDELAAVDLTAITDPHTLHLEGERASRLHALEANRRALLDNDARLATHPAFDTRDRLAWAEAFLVELSRGRSPAARVAALAEAQRSAPDGSELALMLDVTMALWSLNDANQEDVRSRLFALYTGEQDPMRRRAIALATVRYASSHGNEFLQYEFATTWASGMRPDEPERRYAEELYRTIVLERAYGALADDRLDEAAAYFSQANRDAEAFDAHIGFVETRLARGCEDLRALYGQRFRDEPDDPAYLFVRAYLEARELPRMEEHARIAGIVRHVNGLLERVDAAWPRRAEVHLLWAYVLHHAALASGSHRDAGAANSHYLLALDLARDRPRARASILLGAGLLQASLGNNRRALEHFERRARLPFARHETELAFELARARSYFHARLPENARESTDRAQALLDAHPSELGRFRTLVLDRRAFYTLYAGAADSAATLYAELESSLSGEDDTPVHRLDASIGLGSASLYRRDFETALRALDRATATLEANPHLAAEARGSIVERYEYTHARYVALVDGLRGEALAGLGRYDDASTAFAERATDLERLLRESKSDIDVLAVAQVRLRETQTARAAGRIEDAVRLAESGLARIDELDRHRGSTVTETGVDLLRAYAELVLFDGARSMTLARDLRADLTHAYELMTRYPSRRFRNDRARFELYLALLRTDERSARVPHPDHGAVRPR